MVGDKLLRKGLFVLRLRMEIMLFFGVLWSLMIFILKLWFWRVLIMVLVMGFFGCVDRMEMFWWFMGGGGVFDVI